MHEADKRSYKKNWEISSPPTGANYVGGGRGVRGLAAVIWLSCSQQPSKLQRISGFLEREK